MMRDTQRFVMAGERAIPTDSEGYLRSLSDWSEEFAKALAREEGLQLTPEHWEVIRYLRSHYQEHGVQAQVRVMIRHFTQAWGPPRMILTPGSHDFTCRAVSRTW